MRAKQWIMVTASILGLIAHSPCALAKNDTIISQMAEVIKEDKRMSADKQERMIEIATEVLSSYPVLGEDKSRNVKRHLRVYLDDIIRGTQRYTDSQFEVVGQTFRWALGNYASVPPISDGDRKQITMVVSTSFKGSLKFIKSTYQDTPPEVQDDLAKTVRNEAKSLFARAGNYLYPQYLYLKDTQPSTADVVRLLNQEHFLTDNSRKFAPVAAILADTGIAEKSRKEHVKFFVNHQSSLIGFAVTRVASKFFDMSRAKGYSIPPQDLLEAHKVLAKELKEAAVKRRQEQQKKMRYEALVREVLADTGIDVIDGNSILPDEYLDHLEPVRHITAEERQILLPRMDLALSKSKPFVLDLSRCRLISVPAENGIDTEKVSLYFKKLGQGDLAWDGVLISCRGAKIISRTEENEQTMACTAGKYTRKYKLPEILSLPYYFVVSTVEKISYRVEIIRITPEAVEIRYKRLT